MSLWSPSNILAGLVLNIRRPFAMGDRIRFGEHEGEVVEPAFLFTRLRTAQQIEVIIPNGLFLKAPIEQLSTDSGLIVGCEVRVGYHVAREMVELMLLEAAQRVGGITDDPMPFVRISALDERAIAYELCVHLPKPQAKDHLLSDLRASIVDVFAENRVMTGPDAPASQPR
jgi:small-conductance mechanosensitive channel